MRIWNGYQVGHTSIVGKYVTTLMHTFIRIMKITDTKRGTITLKYTANAAGPGISTAQHSTRHAKPLKSLSRSGILQKSQ